MANRIVVDPATLLTHASELGRLASELTAELSALRAAVGFLPVRADLPNGAAIGMALNNVVRLLEDASVSSTSLGLAVVRHAKQVVTDEQALRAGRPPQESATAKPNRADRPATPPKRRAGSKDSSGYPQVALKGSFGDDLDSGTSVTRVGDDGTYTRSTDERSSDGYRKRREWGIGSPDDKPKNRNKWDTDVGVFSAKESLLKEEFREHTWGTEEGNHVRVEAGSAASDLTANLSVTDTGLKATSALTGRAHLARVSGQHESLGGTLSGEASVGADATVSNDISVGTDGVSVKGGIGAFAGAKAEAQRSQAIGPADLGVGGELSAGLGGHVDGSASFTPEKIGFAVDVGGTLGLGGSVKVDLSVNPREALEDVKGAWDKASGLASRAKFW